MKKILLLAAAGFFAYSPAVFSVTPWMRRHPDVSWQYLARWEREHQWLTPAREGRLHFQKHEVGRARELMEQAVADGARDGKLFYELGYSCRVQGDDEAALKHLEEAARLLARDDPGHLYHFNSLYLSGLILEERGEEERALARYREALRLRPDVSPLRYRKAYLLSRKGERERSRDEIGRVLARDPGSGPALYLSGLFALEEGDYARARKDLEGALRAGVDPAPAHYGLGYAALRRGDAREAFVRYESALEADPGHRDALVALANLAYREDDLDRARKYFELLAAREPGQARWHYNLGVVYRDLGQEELSRESLSEAARIDPDLRVREATVSEAADLFNRAGKLHSEGKYGEAIELYREALAEDPFFLPAHFNLASAYRADGSWRAAYRQYERLLRVEPDHPGARLNAGIVAIDLRDRPAAARHLRRYLQLAPDSPQADLAGRYLKEMRGW